MTEISRDDVWKIFGRITMNARKGIGESLQDCSVCDELEKHYSDVQILRTVLQDRLEQPDWEAIAEEQNNALRAARAIFFAMGIRASDEIAGNPYSLVEQAIAKYEQAKEK